MMCFFIFLKLFQLRADDSGLLRVLFFHFCTGLFQKSGIAPFEHLFLIVPVIHALIISQQHVHIRRIAGKTVDPRSVMPQRMSSTSAKDKLFLFLIQPRKQQDQKGHVIGQRELAADPVSFLQLPAQAAVIGLIQVKFPEFQFLLIYDDISKHIRSSL